MSAGLEPFMASDSIQARATKLTLAVLQQADVALYLADAKYTLPAASHSSWTHRLRSVNLYNHLQHIGIALHMMHSYYSQA